MFILGFLFGCLFCIILMKYEINRTTKYYNTRLDYWQEQTLMYQKLWLDSTKDDDVDWWKRN